MFKNEQNIQRDLISAPQYVMHWEISPMDQLLHSSYSPKKCQWFKLRYFCLAWIWIGRKPDPLVIDGQKVDSTASCVNQHSLITAQEHLTASVFQPLCRTAREGYSQRMKKAGDLCAPSPATPCTQIQLPWTLQAVSPSTFCCFGLARPWHCGGVWFPFISLLQSYPCLPSLVGKLKTLHAELCHSQTSNE